MGDAESLADDGDVFRALLGGAEAGDAAAFTALFQRYWPDVHRVASRRMERRLRSRVDSVDVAQAVWISFLAATPDWNRFSDPDDLVDYLAGMVRHKMVDVFRRAAAGRRNIMLEQEASADVEPEDDSISASASTGAAPGATCHLDTPSALAVAAEVWEKLLASQPPHYQRILIMRRDGYFQEEIAAEMGISERTVRRVIERAFESLEHESVDEP